MAGELRVLMVTSDDVLMASMQEVLQREDFSYSHAAALDVALQHVGNHHPEIALVDSSVANGSVIHVVEQLVEAGSDTAVVLILNDPNSELAASALRAGAYDFLPTPFSVQEVPFRLRVINERRERDLDTRIYNLALENRLNARTEEVWTSHEKLRRQFYAMMQALQKALQARHVYTEGHSRRVAKKSVQIAKLMSLSEKVVKDIEFAALFHDLGKIGIRDEVLNKPSKLTTEEYEHMKLHPIIAAQILEPLEELAEVVPMLKHEHESWDGNGYPDHLKGTDIPLGSRIIAVADTWDSLVYDRIYRRGCSREAALVEIERCSGIQFDPTIVKVFTAYERQRLKEKEEQTV